MTPPNAITSFCKVTYVSILAVSSFRIPLHASSAIEMLNAADAADASAVTTLGLVP